MKKITATILCAFLLAGIFGACEHNERPSLGEHDWMHETGPVLAPMATGDLAITHRAVEMSAVEEQPETFDLTETVTAKGKGELLVPFFGSLDWVAARTITLDGKEIPSELVINAEPDEITAGSRPTMEEMTHFFERKDLYTTLRTRTTADAKLHTLELDLSDLPQNTRVTLIFDRAGLAEIGANAYSAMEEGETFFTWTKTKDLTRAAVLSKDEVPDPVSVEIVRRTGEDKEETITAEIPTERGETTVAQEMGAFWDAYEKEGRVQSDVRFRALAIRAATAKWLASDGEPSIEDVFGVALYERRLFFHVVPVDLGAGEREITIKGRTFASYNYPDAGPRSRRNLYGISFLGGTYDTTLEMKLPASSNMVYTSNGKDYTETNALDQTLVRIEYTRPEPKTQEP